MKWAGIAQSVYQLASRRTVRGSNTGKGEIFRTNPDRTWAYGASSAVGARSLSRDKNGRGVALTTQPHLASRLKKSTSTLLLPLWTFLTCSRLIFIFTFTDVRS